MTQQAFCRLALSGAHQIRKRIGVDFDEPVAIIDAAIHLQIHVSIVDLSSVEGIWCREKRAMVLTSRRTLGRHFFTCAHELAHWHFNDATCVDELVAMSGSHDDRPEEKLANLFAGYLLMPPRGIPSAIRARGWNLDALRPEQVYILACCYGVSYSALISHLSMTLKCIDYSAYCRLKKVQPKSIKAHFCPVSSSLNLIVVDDYWWPRRPVDLEVGDTLSFPKGAEVDDQYFLLTTPNCAIARQPGVSWLTNMPKTKDLLVRIAPSANNGFGQYRYPSHNNVYCPTQRLN